MALARITRHWFIVLMITLISCNGPSQNGAISIRTHVDSTAFIANPTDLPEEIVYFSHDDGLSWENASTGLGATTNIGLGGIAASDHKLALLSKDRGLYFYSFQKKRWINTPTYKPLIESNPGALLFFKDHIYVGTQYRGVFRTGDEGKTWTAFNFGLDDLTIRKFAEIKNKLYAATNSGLFSLDEQSGRWEHEYGKNPLQVNGITAFGGSIYIATNQGAFSSPLYGLVP